MNTGSPAAWPVHEAGIAAVPARDAGARAQAYFARWGDAGEVDLSKAFAELIILTASRTLMGARRAAAARRARAGARMRRGCTRAPARMYAVGRRGALAEGWAGMGPRRGALAEGWAGMGPRLS